MTKLKAPARNLTSAVAGLGQVLSTWTSDQIFDLDISTLSSVLKAGGSGIYLRGLQEWQGTTTMSLHHFTVPIQFPIITSIITSSGDQLAMKGLGK